MSEKVKNNVSKTVTKNVHLNCDTKGEASFANLDENRKQNSLAKRLSPSLQPATPSYATPSPMGKAPKTPIESHGFGIANAIPLKQEVSTLYSSFLLSNFSSLEIQSILKESNKFFPVEHIEPNELTSLSYKEIQNKLSTLNEVSLYRKKSGVYYTENDITNFIVSNCLKLSSGIDAKSLKSRDYSNICRKTVFDPTCGSGAFLLTALELKLVASETEKVSIKQVLNSIYGNDIDETSVLITKLRLFICILNFAGISEIDGVSEILNSNLYSSDFFSLGINKKFDLVIGNPPYVEESKSNSKLENHFGNIYANVLADSTKYLNETGNFGFIVPLSYCATPRMAKVRKLLSEKLNTQLILSYADRPGCLFSGVHQKLNIILGSVNGSGELYTSNYQYWYKEERKNLFENQGSVLPTN